MLVKYEFVIDAVNEIEADKLLEQFREVADRHLAALTGGWTLVDTETEEDDDGDQN